METKNKFPHIAIENGYSYYEILISVFLNKFKFLREYKYGSYESVKYSWSAQEHVIEVYSERTKINIVFLEEGGRLEVYFHKRYSIFNVKKVPLNALVTAKDRPIRSQITLETVEEVLTAYATVLKTRLEPVLRGERKL